MHYNAKSFYFQKFCNEIKKTYIHQKGILTIYCENYYKEYINIFINSNEEFKNMCEIIWIEKMNDYNEILKIVQKISEENVLCDLFDLPCKSIVITETLLRDEKIIDFVNNTQIYFYTDLFDFMTFVIEHLKK